MGGRVAEELFTDRVTSGAGNDIERATDIARRMVCELGMSPFGPIAFRPSARPVGRGSRRWRSARRRRAGWTRKSSASCCAATRRPASSSRATPTPSAALAEELLEVESLDAEAVQALLTRESERRSAPRGPRRTELGAWPGLAGLARPSTGLAGLQAARTARPCSARSRSPVRFPRSERFIPYSCPSSVNGICQGPTPSAWSVCRCWPACTGL